MSQDGGITLYIASRIGEIDYFEVAHSLCKFMLSKPRPHDPLLFMTVLQTALKNLKRRGFNVDKILAQRKAEQQAREEEIRHRKLQAELEAAKSPTPAQMQSYEQELSNMFPDADRQYLSQTLARQNADHRQKAIEELQRGGYPKQKSSTSMDGISPPRSEKSGSLLNTFRRRFMPGESSNERRPIEGAAGSDMEPPRSPLPALGSQLEPPPQYTPGQLTPTAAITPTQDIRANVLRAIAAARPDSSNQVRSRPQTTHVKESESTYCDSSGANADLAFTATISNLNFYIDRHIEDTAAVLRRHQPALVRFIDVIVKPVGKVFGLVPSSLHIFYDNEGPLIAFNRNHSLYLNLRYYIAWHDEQVCRGDLADALISCFFTLCHELAHSLVQQHNSEHEFWVQSISEQYFVAMSKYLASVSQQAQPAAAITQNLI